ncbi:tetratricopeptide repeat protein [Hahella sp. SMD15-11]|uniref:Tetratricopeptide repeat protein n=1 Tax=Thermohahella caldifontis TaxID=3142973 RepID=A0AB39UYT0_9GAMM
MKFGRLIFLLPLLCGHLLAWPDESGLIVIDDSEKGKTLGQLKPAYVDFGYRKAPHVPMGEIVSRYRKLILGAPDPEVRLKALHRLLNLENLFAAEYPDGFMDDALWQMAVKTYREWLEAHPGDAAEDQYRYQLARALDMLGKASESRAELETLVRRFPRSALATEAWFRIAERLYAEGRYADAEAAYKKVLAAGNPEFDLKARYMMAWTLFKQNRQAPALDLFVSVLAVPEIDKEAMETLRRDIYRISAIIASEQQGARTLQAAIERAGKPGLAPPLYDALVGLYEKKRPGSWP